MKTLLEQSQVRFFVLVQGGTKTVVKVKTIDEMFDEFAEAAQSMVQHPRIGSIATKPYTSAENYPVTLRPVVLYDAQTQNRNRASRYYQELDQAVGDLTFILAHPEQFEPFDRAALAAELASVRATAVAYYEYLAGEKACLYDIRNCGPLPEAVVALPLKPERLDSSIAGCETRRSHICGVENYVEAVSSYCPVAEWISRADPECVGVNGAQPIYALARGPECEVELYNSGECLVPNYERYPGLPSNPAFPSHVEPDGVACKPGTIRITAGGYHNRTAYTCERYHDGTRYNYWGGEGLGFITDILLQKACRHPDFGTELYRNCRSDRHPVEQWPTCSLEKWGPGKYQSCQHEMHGVELYKACYVRTGADGKDEVCPVN